MQQNNTKSKHTFYLVFWLLFFAVSCDLAEQPISKSQHEFSDSECRYFASSKRLINVELGKGSEIHLTIPEEYVSALRRRRYHRGSSDALLLIAHVDGFAPFAEPPPTGEQLFNYMSVLIIDQNIDVWRDLRAILRVREEMKNEDLLLNFARDATLQSGLLFNPTAHRSQDIYVNIDPRNMLQDVIRCSRKGSVPYPRCTHFITTKNFSIQMGYSKNSLNNWQKIADDARQFADCIYRK